MLVNLRAALFILPFFLFSATAGQLADKHDKTRLIRCVKLFEIGIMVARRRSGSCVTSLALLLGALFLMGLHSTFFGPVKYAILPQHLKPNELVGGNALVEMGTFLAILLGTIAGRRARRERRAPASLVSLRAASRSRCAGYLVEPRDPGRRAAAPELAHRLEPVHRNLGESALRARQPHGVSVGARHLVVLVLRRDAARAVSAYCKDVLGGDEHVVTLLLALFSVGVGVGSLLCERLSGRKVEIGLVPFGSIGLTRVRARPVSSRVRRVTRRGARRRRRSSSRAGALAHRCSTSC